MLYSATPQFAVQFSSSQIKKPAWGQTNNIANFDLWTSFHTSSPENPGDLHKFDGLCLCVHIGKSSLIFDLLVPVGRDQFLCRYFFYFSTVWGFSENLTNTRHVGGHKLPLGLRA